MNTITVDKANLIKKLRENQAQHAKQYLEAVAGWHAKVLTALREAAADFERRKLDADITLLNFHFRFPKPSEHTSEYETALQMLSWESGDLIGLDETEFRRLVQDDWDWSRQFATTASQYRAT